MRSLLLLLLLSCLLFTVVSANDDSGKKQKKKKINASGQEEEVEDDPFNDYEVYEAMATMRQLTDAETFYDLLGVSSSTADDQIGRAFRKLSVKYHPDKHGPGTAKMFKLIQYVSTLLRDKKGRAKYEWLLHEAPAWHRESVYMARKVSKVAKINLKQAIMFTFGLSLLGQFLIQWVAFCIQYARILSSSKSLKGMGEKEVKRIRRKLESGDATFQAQNKSDYEVVLLADSPRPPFPTPLDLFIFAIPISITRKLISLVSKPKSE